MPSKRYLGPPPPEGHKVCVSCYDKFRIDKVTKYIHPRNNFYKNQANSDGYDRYCVSCQVHKNKLRYKKTVIRNLGREPEPPPPVDLKENTHKIGEIADEVVESRRKSEQAKRERQLREDNQKLIEENAKLRKDIEILHNIGAQTKKIHIWAKNKKHTAQDGIAGIVASDWHVEEIVKADSVQGLNEFNTTIAKQRVESFARNALRLTDIQAKEMKINKVIVYADGDFYTGYLHEENQETNELGPTDAANYVIELWVSTIQYWLKESNYTFYFDGIPGNHGRLTKKLRFGNVSGTSLEYFTYKQIARNFEGNPRIKFTLPRSGMHFRQLFPHYTTRQVHGYEIRYSGGVGGLTVPVKKRVHVWNKAQQCELTIIGHFHQSVIDKTSFLVNNSLIGYNGYAQANGFDFSEPTQTWFLVTARKGGSLSGVFDIWLDDAHRNVATAHGVIADVTK